MVYKKKKKKKVNMWIKCFKWFSKFPRYNNNLFCLTGIQLAPKEKLDIPVLFMPDTMKMYETAVVIHVMRENGENWPYEDSAELSKDLKR